MIIPTTIIQVGPCQTGHITWRESLSPANKTALKFITAFRWRTNGQWKCSHLIWLAENLPRKTCKRSQQICVCVFKLHAWVLRTSCQSWPMCSICGLHWEWSQNAAHLTLNIRAVFKSIRQAGLKQTIEECHFRIGKVKFLGRTISSEGISSEARKCQNC